MLKTSKSENMRKSDFEKEAVAFCFDNGINITPHQAAIIAEFFYTNGYGDGYEDGTSDEKNHVWD